MATDKSKTGVTATTAVHEDGNVPSTADSITSTPKTAPTTTTTVLSGDDDTLISAEESGVRKPDRDLRAAVWTIVCGVALPCVPIIAVSVALLAMILTKRQKIEPGWPELMLPTSEDTDNSAAHNLWKLRHLGGQWAYYTDRNPTTITTVASWTSRVLPYLTSSIMALVAFFAARRIATKSKRGGGDDLPTPTEVTLLINLLSGKDFGPLKDTLLHRWAYKKKLADPIPLAFTALSLITCVGILIPIIDTWFGISTTPQSITLISNSTDGPHQFGRSLSTTLCPHGPGSFVDGLQWIPCNLAVDKEGGGDTVADDLTFQLIGADNVMKVVENENDNYTIGSTVGYIGDERTIFYYLEDPFAESTWLDHKAQTYAMTAQCTPVTQQCLPGATWPIFANDDYNTAYFNCSPGFQGNFSFPGAAQTRDAAVDDDSVNNTGGSDANTATSNNPTLGLAFATDANLTQRIGVYNPTLPNISLSSVSSLVGSNLSYSYVQPQNPFYFGAWGVGFPTYTAFLGNNTATIANTLLNDSQIYRSPSTGNTYWVLSCSATVHEFNYTWVNGSILTHSHRPASPEMAAVFAAPFAVAGIPQAYQQLMLTGIRASAAYDMVTLAGWFATYWSQAALALSTGVLQQDDTLMEQNRTMIGPVTRVPMVPLYLLLGLKAVYVLAVILLAIGAYCFTHPAETELIKEQLSAKGLAAAHFDDPGILQKNATTTLEEHLLPTPATTGLNEKTGTKVVESEKVAEEEPTPGVTKTVTGLDEMTEKRVGLVARADGAWRFAVIANGMWNGIKPIAVDLIGLEAKNGNLGEAGDFINAWRK